MNLIAENLVPTIDPIFLDGDNTSKDFKSFTLDEIPNTIKNHHLFRFTNKKLKSKSHEPIITLALAKIQKSINIFGEEFYFDKIDGEFYIHHPKWSLSGEGNTILEAENNLRTEAKEVFSILSISKNLDYSAKKMLEFISQIL